MEDKIVAEEHRRKERFKKLREGLPPISRVYLGYGIAYTKFYYRPINAIRLFETSYELISDINPKCSLCHRVMRITSNIDTGCMDYFCKGCQRPWTKRWSKRGSALSLRLRLSVLGPPLRVPTSPSRELKCGTTFTSIPWGLSGLNTLMKSPTRCEQASHISQRKPADQSSQTGKMRIICHWRSPKASLKGLGLESKS